MNETSNDGHAQYEHTTLREKTLNNCIYVLCLDSFNKQRILIASRNELHYSSIELKHSIFVAVEPSKSRGDLKIP